MTVQTVTISVQDYLALARAVGLYRRLRGAHGPPAGEEPDDFGQMAGAQARAKVRLAKLADPGGDLPGPVAIELDVGRVDTAQMRGMLANLVERARLHGGTDKLLAYYRTTALLGDQWAELVEAELSGDRAALEARFDEYVATASRMMILAQEVGLMTAARPP